MALEDGETQDGESGGTLESVPPSTWNVGLAVLKDLLAKQGGRVSSLALRQALEAQGIQDARQLVVQIRFWDFDAPAEGLTPPDFHWYTHSRSFYADEAYQRLEKEQQCEAEAAAREPLVEDTAPDDEQALAPARERPRMRQEEGRLGTYVVSALEDIYQPEFTTLDAPYVFDVHRERPGNEFENVDVMAVHWRTEKVVDLVAIEVKLDFTSRLVQQARNYTRFADRVWVAVPVRAEAQSVAQALKELDALLFEHIVDVGIGILGCRRRPGKSYEIIPVQWPRRTHPDPVEREGFIERYRQHFEQARVVAPRGRYQYPTL
jgi:hypothetical protein